MSTPTKPAAQSKTRFYPNRSDFDTHAQWDAHRQTLDLLYKMQDEHTANLKVLEDRANQPAAPAPSFPNQPHNTVIAGFQVSPQQPSNGQVLKFNQSSGKIEWS